MNIPNHITLEALKHMPVGEIAALSAAELARLQQETTKALRSAKLACEWLDGALALKYADQADALRRTAQKDTGTVRFADGEVTVKADLPVNERLKLTRPQHLKVAHLGWRKAHGRDALI